MTKNSLPLISVIITNYNYGEYVGQAIESVLSQTYQNIELIIIDDGSTDDSGKVIRSYIERHAKITYIKQKNKGVVSARNRGMEMAKGEYVCCLDADDFFSPDYIEKNYKYITKYNADVVYPNWQFTGDWNHKTNFQEFDFIEYQKQHLHIKPESLIRSSAIKLKNGTLKYGYLPETKARANDWVYFISLAATGLKFKLAKDNYINYRIKKDAMHARFTKYEEIKIFHKYLTLLKERYGKKIIDPIDLPIDIIERQDEEIGTLKQSISDKDSDTRQLVQINDDLKQEINDLKQGMSRIYSSWSWKITKPLRVINRLFR